jgi:phytoene/squalene synthetase
MQQYTETCYKLSKTITRDYSTSFSLGIHMLDRSFHPAIYAIYGFVRLADEIVDTFHGHDKSTLLEKFKAETDAALRDRVSTNTVLHAFQDVVHRYGIEREMIDAFLHSMEMDLHPVLYTDALYNEYIYGSAEVVGLMCLRVFCQGDDAAYRSLREPARRLGAAFQKVNFLRDLRSDHDERGRVYFPGVDFTRFDHAAKEQIEADILADFDASLPGIRALPQGARLGVTVAYIYYKALFRKIRLLPAQRIRQERIRVPNLQKFLLLVQTWVRYRLRLV